MDNVKLTFSFRVVAQPNTFILKSRMPIVRPFYIKDCM